MNPPNHPARQRAEADYLAALRRGVSDLRQYVEAHNWAGYDPYDALNSRLLQRLGLLRFRLPRLAFTQLLKRCPLNLRPCLGIPREQNPKGIAVFLAAYVRLYKLGLVDETMVRHLAERLMELCTPGQRHACWGYNFAWQTRTYLVPRGTPNIICTTFAANALLDAHALFDQDAWLEAARSAGHFLLEGLNRTTEGDALCFSYTPVDHSRVHNANLLGAALLARLNNLRPEPAFEQVARAATRYALRWQRADGSWPYGEAATQQWVDSFHTGYNLCALAVLGRSLALAECEAALDRGYRYYLDHFFAPGGVARYFHNRTWPVDIHSIAQALITLTTLAGRDERSLPLADAVACWALQHMRHPLGWFYYQKWPLWTNRVNYMRWSQAWMLLGLTSLLQARGAPQQATVFQDRLVASLSPDSANVR